MRGPRGRGGARLRDRPARGPLLLTVDADVDAGAPGRPVDRRHRGRRQGRRRLDGHRAGGLGLPRPRLAPRRHHAADADCHQRQARRLRRSGSRPARARSLRSAPRPTGCLAGRCAGSSDIGDRGSPANRRRARGRAAIARRKGRATTCRWHRLVFAGVTARGSIRICVIREGVIPIVSSALEGGPVGGISAVSLSAADSPECGSREARRRRAKLVAPDAGAGPSAPSARCRVQAVHSCHGHARHPSGGRWRRRDRLAPQRIRHAGPVVHPVSWSDACAGEGNQARSTRRRRPVIPEGAATSPGSSGSRRADTCGRGPRSRDRRASRPPS